MRAPLRNVTDVVSVLGVRTAPQDPPTRIRWTSVRLAEPLVLRRPWRRPWLEHPDGTPLATDADGARVAQGPDGRPVRVGARFSFLQTGWVLEVDGRPVPATAPMSRSAGFGVLTAVACAYVLGGAVGAALCYPSATLAIAVARCEGDRCDAPAPGADGRDRGRGRRDRGGRGRVLVVRALGRPPALSFYFGMVGAV